MPSSPRTFASAPIVEGQRGVDLKAPWWRFLLARLGIGGVARALRTAAQEAGVSLEWSVRGVAIRTAEIEILLAPDDFFELFRMLPVLERLKLRAHFVPLGGRRFADLRGIRRYCCFNSEEWLWHPSPPELEDFYAGYLLRGGPEAGAVVFDAGAYVGEVTIQLARRVGSGGHVYAFEPDPRVAVFLERNVRDAALGNVTIVGKGLWSETTQRVLSGGACGASVTDQRGPGDAFAVEMLSFADACHLAGRAPDFVKMDIEGAELETIRAGLDVIRQNRIRFAIASYHEREGQPTSAALETMFAAAGYAVETGYPAHLTTWAWPQQ